MICLRTLFFLVLWAVVSCLAQWLIGDPAGWLLFSATLVAILLWRSWRLRFIAAWAQHPDQAPPPAMGPWDDILAPLYRHLRARARELNETHDSLQGMLAAAQALPDGAVTLNEDYQIDWCNRMARLHLGLRLPTDRGHSLLNLLRAPEFVEYAHRRAWPDPILVRLNQNGQERLMMMQLTAYASNQRLLITRDVTQIERLETTRRDFVANVSHELRTPLTVLSGFLETLRELPATALPETQRAQYMDMMYEQAQRMQAIVEDLLTLSTLESSPGGEAQTLCMSDLLQKVRQQSEALSAGRHVWDWHIDPTLDMLGVETEIHSALSNLLTNAVRYTPDGGTITVRWAKEHDGAACYSVQDTGIGIAARHLPRLTERFYRVDRGRSRAVGGTGLGLAITKHIAMRHEAELLISSEPGKGSRFTLRIPAERIVTAHTV